MTLRSGHRSSATTAVQRVAGRPIMLFTFDVPVATAAAILAVDAAVESGQPLLVVNVVELPIRPMTGSWGQEIVVAEDVDASLRAPADLARSLAVEVERIRLVSPRPLAALVELVGERTPSLLVLGPDRERIGRRRLARLERKVRSAAPCLVWSVTDTESV